MKFRKKLGVESEIPSASMSDIAFLLIIFFMVTTVFSVTRGIEFKLPKDKPSDETETREATLIEVFADGSLLVDNKPMMPENISAYLKPKLERNPEKFVIIKTDLDAQYGRMIEVLDQLELLKVKNIVLPTQREIESWGDYRSRY